MITSAGSATVLENSAGAILSLTASGGTGSFSYVISGGPDADLFALSGSGALSFLASPDFEVPRDADSDNEYLLSVRVSSGSRSATTDLVVTVTNDREGINVTRIATGFVDPVCIDFLNEGPAFTAGPQGRIAVGEKSGRIYDLNGTTGEVTLITEALAGRPAGELIECTSFSRRSSGYFSGLYVVVRETDGRVAMWNLDRESSVLEQTLLPIGSPASRVSLAYGPGARFFLAIGDIDGMAAQMAGSPLGKLYALNPVDPYAGASLRPVGFWVENIGDGIRDPDGATMFGEVMIFADKGGSSFHELNRFHPDEVGLDFGWPDLEGSLDMSGSAAPGAREPFATYPVGDQTREGVGIIGGDAYVGPASELLDRYIFADRNGTIWSIPTSFTTDGEMHEGATLENRTDDFVPDVGNIDAPVGITVNDLGQMVILDADGEVFRVDGT